MYGRGEVVVPPRIGGVQWPTTVESTLCRTRDCGAGHAAVLGGALIWRRSRRRPCGSGRRRGGCCGGYRPPGVAGQCSEGPAGQGLVLVMVGATSEARAHAVRGFRGGENTREVRGVGSTVVGAVPSTSCTASGRVVCTFRQGVASSEAEAIRSFKGRLPTLERGGVSLLSRG